MFPYFIINTDTVSTITARITGFTSTFWNVFSERKVHTSNRWDAIVFSFWIPIITVDRLWLHQAHTFTFKNFMINSTPAAIITNILAIILARAGSIQGVILHMATLLFPGYDDIIKASRVVLIDVTNCIQPLLTSFCHLCTICIFALGFRLILLLALCTSILITPLGFVIILSPHFKDVFVLQKPWELLIREIDDGISENRMWISFSST